MADSSPFEEIQWDVLLQDLPESPTICLDDLGLPLSPRYFNEDDPRNEDEDQILQTCNGGDDINSVVNLHETEQREGENLSSEQSLHSSVLELSALGEILLSDDVLNIPTFDANVVEANEFIDIDSFFAGICSPQQEPNQDDHGALNVQSSSGGNATGKGGELPEEGDEKLGACGRKRKRNRDSASKSRERKKIYVRSLQTKCRLLERDCGNLEEALRYSALENATLRNELYRMAKKNPRVEADKTKVVSCNSHGGCKTDEPAVLVMDSPQKEFLFCVVMMMMAMHLIILPVLLFLMACKHPRAPRKTEMANEERHCSTKKKKRMLMITIIYGNVGEGERLRKWIWCRKRMKLC